MSAEPKLDNHAKAYVRLLQNPYATLSVGEAPADKAPTEVTLEQRREYFRRLQNPHAHSAVFGDPDIDDSAVARPGRFLSSTEPAGTRPGEQFDVGVELDDLLNLYKPYVARNEWSRVNEYRASFVNRVVSRNVDVTRLVSRIRNLKFSLLPGEKVEYNRAPAQRIINEIEGLLD